MRCLGMAFVSITLNIVAKSLDMEVCHGFRLKHITLVYSFPLLLLVVE